MKTCVLLATIVVALLLSPLAPAAGRTATKVTVHISPGGTADYFYGLVKADRGTCRSRRLNVLRDPDGSSGYSAYAEGVVSNRDGTWTVDPPEPIPNGFYKVVAQRKATASRSCRKGASKAFFVD